MARAGCHVLGVGAATTAAPTSNATADSAKPLVPGAAADQRHPDRAAGLPGVLLTAASIPARWAGTHEMGIDPT